MTWPLALFLVVLGATGSMRIVELVVSRRRIAERRQGLVAEPRLFPLMAALHAGLVVLPAAEVLVLDRPFLPPLFAAAALTLVGATALRVWTLSSLGTAWNVRVLHPVAIVTRGPYRWIRHPNYLAVILEIGSIPLLHTAWMSAVLLTAGNALVLRRRIAVEESALAASAEWREAMSGKSRFIPGVW